MSSLEVFGIIKLFDEAVSFVDVGFCVDTKIIIFRSPENVWQATIELPSLSEASDTFSRKNSIRSSNSGD